MILVSSLHHLIREDHPGERRSGNSATDDSIAGMPVETSQAAVSVGYESLSFRREVIARECAPARRRLENADREGRLRFQYIRAHRLIQTRQDDPASARAGDARGRGGRAVLFR